MMEQTTIPEAPPAMSARYRITESDYQRAMALAMRSKSNMPAVLFLSGMLLVVVTVIANIVWGYFAGAIGVYVLAIALIFPPWKWKSYREYWQSMPKPNELAVALLDEEMRFSSPDGESPLVWSNILKWRWNKSCVLIYTTPRLFFVIPTTVAEQGFDMERLKAALTQHVGPAELGR